MVLAALLVAAATLADLEVALQPAPGRLTVQMAVGSKLPDDWTQALSAGAPVSITYRLRLYRNRRWLWDLRLASHELVVKAQRDPLTGVFSLVSEIDEEILASGQADTLDEAVGQRTGFCQGTQLETFLIAEDDGVFGSTGFHGSSP